MQEEAEQLFGEMKYLQSAKIAAQIASACESKEYSAEVVAKFNQVCVSDLIAKSKFKAAVLVLKEILLIVQNSLLKGGEDAILPENFAEYQNLKRLTLNNLGCALKKSGQIDEAQFYFEQITNQDPLYELNLCAVQNQKGNHRQALIHAQQAATLLEAEVKDLRVQLEKGDLEESADKDFFLERTSLLAIAYYNQGCELEHLENLMRATQAFSRAVSLQSSKHANQQLLTQFKLSLKQARFKLRQQMVPGNTLSQQQIMRETTMSVPIFHDGTKFGAYGDQNISGDKRPYSAINNQFGSPYRFQSAGAKKQLPKIAKVQGSSVYSVDKKQKMVMRMSVHSNMSQHSHHSDLSEQQQAIVDQMNQRPSHQDSRLARGKKQANQSGSNSNSLRQKQQILKASQPDLGTGLGYHHSRSASATHQKPSNSYNIGASPVKKSQGQNQNLPPIASSKVQNESQKVFTSNSVKNSYPLQSAGALHKSPLKDASHKPPFAVQTKSFPNKKVDNTKALKALKDLGLAKGSIQQQQKTLDAIMKIQRWIRVRIIRKNFLKAIKQNARQAEIKNAASKTRQSAAVAQKKKNMVNVVSGFDKFGSGSDLAKKQKCARIIQTYIRRRRFRKLVHAMIIRRKVQLGYYSKAKMDEIEWSTRKRLDDLDKKLRKDQQISKKEDFKRNKAIKMIQSLVRRRRFRKIVSSVSKAAKELAKNGQTGQNVKSSMREAFLKKIFQKAKEIREAEMRLAVVHRANLKSSVRVLQAWIRRRRFRKAVYAMILFRKVSTGRLPVSQLRKIDAATYKSVLNANKMRKIEEKQQKQEEIREKAARMIQSLFRRRRFRSLVNIIIKIQKDTRSTNKQKKSLSTSAQEKERNATLQAAFLRHKAQVAKNAAFQAKKKKAIRLIQSFVRCRKFRKLVEARLLLHKFSQGRVKASALRKIDPKIREAILNADRKTNVEQKRFQRSVKFIQSFVRRRKFRQLVYWMIQVRKLSNQQAGAKNKNLKLTDRQISQLAQKANQMRKQHNLERIEQHKKERIAVKVIGSFLKRWRFRKAVQALVASKKVGKKALKTISAVLRAQLQLAAAIQRTRETLLTQQRRKEICIRIIQRFIRVRRFRKAVEAIVEINRRHRESNTVYQVMFTQKVWEARALQKQMAYDRIVQNRKEKRAIALIQSFIRRRNFRRVIEAIMLQIRIKKGRASAKDIKKANVSPLVKSKLNDWDKVTRKQEGHQKKLLKATRMIQSWYRRRKFRKLVEAMVELSRGSKKGQRPKGNKLVQANDLRKKLQKNEKKERQKVLKAVRLVQRWFRRRKFRQLVFAMVVRSQIQKKKLTGAALNKHSKQTLDRLNRADAYQKQIMLQNKKEERAIKFVQRWYRMRRFRKAVWSVIEAGRQLQSNWVNSRHFLSAKDKALFDERIVLKANFLRKQALKNEVEQRARLKKSIKFLQSWWRRRKFRRLVEQVIAKRRKQRQGASSISRPAQDKKAVASRSFVNDQSPKPVKQQFNSRNFTSPQKTKNHTEIISRKPAEQAFMATTQETPSAQKIVIDYWQDGMQVEFQQAFTKKKPLVMVNLVINAQTVDRKVIPIDLYHCALDAGDYDLHHFCDQQLMPCIQIKERSGAYSLEILEELVQELQNKNQVNEFDQQRINTASSFGRGSEQNEATLKLLQKKLTGMMPLVKRNATLNGKEYVVQAICDFDMQVVKLTAEREDAYLFLNVQMTQHLGPVTYDQLPSICSYATDLTHQLTIMRDELQLRKALPCLHDDEVILRTSATIRERFYLVSIGHQGGSLIIEALDKAREIRLQLKIGKYSEETQLSQDEASKLVAKLDTKTISGESVLVLK